MKTRYYINNLGEYQGGFAGKSQPIGLTEVDTAPENVADRYIDGVWVEDKTTRKIALINDLENQITPRMMREALLGNTTKLQLIEDEIATLRLSL